MDFGSEGGNGDAGVEARQRPGERWLRGVRGATTVERDEASLVLAATRELLAAMLHENGIDDFDPIGSIFFTSTPDLVSTYPAEAARELGMGAVPLICNQEIPVPGRLPRVVRVMMQVNSVRGQREIRHVYLRGATVLRPDLTSAQ
ncbi:MAG: chorismate mutase [Trueperaceae bacterium]